MFNRPLLPCLFLFMAGILTGRLLSIHNTNLIILIFSLTVLFLILSILFSGNIKVVFILTLFFIFGVFNVFQSGHSFDLTQFIQDRDRVIIEGTVLSHPEISTDTNRFELRTEMITAGEKTVSLQKKMLTTVYRKSPNLEIGDRIRFPANLRSFRNFNNPGRYNYEAAMKNRGLMLNASVSDGRYIVPIGKGELGFPLKILETIRSPVRNFLTDSLPLQSQAIYRALILGERDGIDPQLREQFNSSGLGHLLAVSGLHIGLIAWLSFYVFRWLLSLSYSLAVKIDIRKTSALFTCLPVIFYTGLAGFQISAVRAMIMVTAYLVSIIIDREKEIWSTLALAAMVILAIDPHSLTGISFQFTFLAVTGIVWLTPVFQKLMPNPFSDSEKRRSLAVIYNYITGIVSASISASLFLLPVILFYFQRISLVSIPANLTSVPVLGFWVLPIGLLSTLLLPVSHTFAGLFLNLGSAGLDMMMTVIRFWSGFKYSSIWMSTPNVFEITLFYSLIFILFNIKRGLWSRVCLTLILLVIAVDASYWLYMTRFNRNLRVTFLDVGQGNAALIQFPGKKRMLIDGGGFRTGTFDTGKNIIMPFLLHSKIMRVDYIVLSHPHPDHMNGLPFIASQFSPKEFWYNGDIVEAPKFEELKAIVKSQNIKIITPPDLSNTRNISGVEVTLLHPAEKKEERLGSRSSRAQNNDSLVLKFSYHDRSFLFTGDIEQDAEDMIVSKRIMDLQSCVLLVPHHGSRFSSTRSFLSKVEPELSIISSGKDNPFGFPHPQTLARLEEAGSEIMRIDQSGAITITSGKDTFKIRSYIE